MDETATRRKKIDPKLYEVGWEEVPESEILTEQRAYQITPGPVERIKHSHPKKADYVLQYHGIKLAVIEAKSDELDVSLGVDQAKLYASMLKLRFTYATNGDKIWAIDMGVQDAKGNYIIPSTEGEVDRFPSPQELWQMTFPDANPWRDKFNLQPLYRDEKRQARYYQEIAVNKVTEAIAKGQRRMLLTMATGTGKTFTAFQICWKLYQTKWNKDDAPNRHPRILFITDRNILANQAVNDFSKFDDDAMVRITPKSLRKAGGKVPTSRNIYFTIFNTLFTSPKQEAAKEGRSTEGESDVEYFFQYSRDFFDLVIIDECHRGGANDESEWRRLMDYFGSAYQLGMTATPRRKWNSNTYEYFGDPVYSYSLKQGIADGFLTPFRVQISSSNIDTYQYDELDKVAKGLIDPDREYTESDFANGVICSRDRDEHRVIELLQKIDPGEKTIVFCCTQKHAMVVRDLINKHKRSSASNYCERVTADDGDEGEVKLKQFQDNENKLPTVLTTSYKLSTGVDARNVRNIVLMRPIRNMVEFKQIIGRGTRLFEGKYYFTIYDYVKASELFKDAEWDGDPSCPICGNYPCSCGKDEGPGGNGGGNGGGNNGGGSKQPHDPCPICGYYPCRCEHKPPQTIEVELSDNRKMTLHTNWEEKIQYDDRLLSIEEFVKELFGRIPHFFSGEKDLRTKWQHPDTRKALLELLEQEGFGEDKLKMLNIVTKCEKCDLLDVLQYIAYQTPPIERALRVQIVEAEYVAHLTLEQQEFDKCILDYYERNGFQELGMEKLMTFAELKYGSITDAKRKLHMDASQMREHYITLQGHLYNIQITGDVHVHGDYYDVHDNKIDEQSLRNKLK